MQATLYQIRSDRFEFESYVGSTTNFRKRRCLHKFHCTNSKSEGHNFAVYQFIRANGGWDDWEMIKLFDVTVKDKEALQKIERQCIEDYGGTLNKQLPGRTPKEWRKDNKEYKQHYCKSWREKNKEHIKAYYEKNKAKRSAQVQCECGHEVSRRSLLRHKTTTKHIQLMAQKGKPALITEQGFKIFK